jgi:hypothetical protein
MKRLARCHIFVLVAAAAIVPLRATGQNITGATKAAPLQVLLVWPGDTTGTVIGYNVYRKETASPSYPSSPLNSSPIRPITDCTQFKTVIPQGSADWNLLAQLLADTTGGTPPLLPLADVCTITSLPPGSSKWNIVQVVAAGRVSVARVMGQLYQDNTVTLGTSYTYQLRRVGSGNVELPPVGLNEITLVAGNPDPIPPPSNVTVVNGDAQIQVLWSIPEQRFTRFVVYRSTLPAGPFQRISDVDLSINITRDIDSNLVFPAKHGFTDYERWDSLGNPVPRTVTGNPFPVTGPANGTTYWYRVALKDILENVGTPSDTVRGFAVDETPPAVPQNIVVEPIESLSGFRIKWSRVKRDIQGRRETVAHYRVYRYKNGSEPGVDSTFVSPVVAQPVGPPPSNDSILIIIKEDLAPGLRSACMDSTIFYRIRAVDTWGNISHVSSAVGAALKDTTKPAIVQGTNAVGFDDYIRVTWKLNTDCDIDQYLIYRALCDYGTWEPCDTTRRVPREPTGQQPREDPKGRGKRKHDCGGPFTLVGVIPHSVAATRGNPTFFDDRTVPEGSPICYAYLVKAQDHSQNISGTFPVPTVPPEKIVCERLRDRTPPEPAVIAGLFARDSAIQVDYIGPPVQDIAAYHIYRSEAGEFGTYKFVGGMTVEPPPGTGTILTAPYTPPPLVGCDSIPLVSRPYMSAGTFIDRNVDRKQIYWYKVLGIDQSGNQSLPDSAMAISTFTFASNRETPPAITAVTPVDTPCALTLTWTPGYDSTVMRGFFVFRGKTAAGPFFQMEGLLKDNTFVDNSVARNTDYWYKVVMLKPDGMLSNMSEAQSGIHP